MGRGDVLRCKRIVDFLCTAALLSATADGADQALSDATLLRLQLGQEDEAIYTPDFLRLADARKSVINFGVGVSYLLKPDLTGFLSLYTDFNNISQNAFNNDFIGTSPYTSYYDVYHCQTGINIKKRKFNFRAGLILAYGSTNKYMQTVNFDHPNEDNFLVGDMDELQIFNRALTPQEVQSIYNAGSTGQCKPQ